MAGPIFETWNLEKLSDVAAELGESPVWSANDNSV